ncbi:MAG: hypothetical protein IPM77_10720 [Crocinitomicaceae bacterium]|nr:hypothetical protein [Crocinitomicaceae bacterium]
MWDKRFLIVFGLIFPLVGLAGGIPVNVRYVSQVISNQSSPVDLIEAVNIGPKEGMVSFEKTDSSFRNWKISGNAFDGGASLFVNKERGVGWLVKAGDDSLKVLIARDYRNAASPAVISITTSFISGLYIIENVSSDCNNSFKVYSLKNSWDADVEYTGKYAIEMEHTNPCGTGKWIVKTGGLKIPKKIMYVAVFAAAMSQNVRFIVKDLVL